MTVRRSWQFSLQLVARTLGIKPAWSPWNQKGTDGETPQTFGESPQSFRHLLRSHSPIRLPSTIMPTYSGTWPENRANPKNTRFIVTNQVHTL